MRVFLVILLTLLSWPSLSQIHALKLDNGLQVIVKEDHRAPVAITMVWYKVGSSDEIGGMTGLAHALEHMMFKGTALYPLGIYSKLIGAIGGEENAFTNNDYTVYLEKIAANQLSLSFKLEADRMQNLILQPEQFNKEIKVIQEERRMRTEDSPQGLTFERFLAAAHLTNPYHHPVIGWMYDLEHMKIEELRQWYERYYAPNNATLVVVGDVNPTEVFALAKQYFGALKSKNIPVTKFQQEPPALGKKTVTIHAAAKLPLLMVGYTVPSVKTAKEAYEPYALEIIANILGGGDSSRMNKVLIRDNHIASGLDAYYNMYTKYQTQFLVYGSPDQAHSIAQLQAGILKQIQQLQETIVPEQELQRVKNQIIAQKTFEQDSIYGQAIELGILETAGIGWQAADAYIGHIKSITPEQIQSVAKRYFIEKSMTTAELIPTSTQGKE